MASCVSQKKFQDMSKLKSGLETQLADCKADEQRLQTQRKSLEEQLARATDNNRKLIQDSTDTGLALRKTQRLYKELTGTYDKLINNHDKLMANSASESSRLSGDLARREAQLKALEANLTTSKSQVDKLSTDLKAREERLN